MVTVMVRPTGFEPATYRVGVCHSIQLSYGRAGAKFIVAYAKIIVKRAPLLQAEQDAPSMQDAHPPSLRMIRAPHRGAWLECIILL